MFRRAILFAALCISVLSYAEDKPCTETTPQPIYISARYTTPDGIGYKPGYTTLEGFFTLLSPKEWIPFLDLRGHVFDNGQFAANAGLGVRYLTCSRLYGLNAYYDYRNTSHQHYNQVSVGFETLGELWDARINGYLPVGTKQSSLYDTKFNSFQDNYLYVRSKREFAMKGANAEVGFHVDNYKPIPLYFATGPYYLTGKGSTAWGGEFRIRADFFDRILRLEANTSYDHIFRWVGQGQISLNLALGRKVKKDCPCNKETTLYTRSVQRVDRFEIIPVDKKHIKSQAIDPATGNPYFFVFVNNTSHSLGTYESPYPTLAIAEANSSQKQILYVFPGDGTSAGMNSGITLKDSQMLFGASIPYQMSTTLGNITIPALASNPPIITNTASAPVIILANNNTVSGMYIENNTGNGIFGNGVTNFTATQNTIIGGAISEGIALENIAGQLTINNNLLVQTGPSSAPNYGVHIQNSTGNFSANFVGDTFYLQPNSNGVSGIYVELSNQASMNNFIVASNHFSNSSGDGIAIEVTAQNDSFVNNVVLTNSTISNFQIGLEVDSFNNSSINTVRVANTQLNKIGYAAIYGDVESTAAIGTFKVTNSNIVTSTTYGIVTYQGTDGTLENLVVSNTNISGCQYGINPELGGAGALTNFTVSHCTFSQNASAIEMDLQSTGSITNCTIKESTFDNNAGIGVYFNFTNNVIIDNAVIANNNITASEYGVLSSLNGTINNLAITECNFSNNMYGISLQNEATPLLNISNNIFAGNQNGIASNAIPATSTGIIKNNQFIGSYNEAMMIATLGGSTNSLSIANNYFSGISAIVGSPIQGYGASITTTAGSSLCLEFVDNTAIPTISGSYAPYLFDASAGTFNLTADTTQANNIGVISQTGSFGACSQ